MTFAPAISARLDARRSVYASRVRLFLLTEAPPGERGYVPVTLPNSVLGELRRGWEPRSGWSPDVGTEGTPLALEVVESRRVPFTALLETGAIGLLRPSEAKAARQEARTPRADVYRIESRAQPVVESKPKWKLTARLVERADEASGTGWVVAAAATGNAITTLAGDPLVTQGGDTLVWGS